MPLSKGALSEKFVQVFQNVELGRISLGKAVGPLMQEPVANALARAYHTWAGDALAGGMTPSGGDPSVIAGPLIGVPLMAGWGPGVTAYWTAVVWATPTVSTGVSIPATLSKISLDLVAQLFTPPFPNPSSPQSKEEFADKLAGILFDNTTAMMVTMTVTAGGATSTVPVT